MSTATSHDIGHDNPAIDHHPHVIPTQVYFGVLMGLLVLTWATVAVRTIDLGGLNIWVAMGIATLKASMVLLFFMHLAYDKTIYAVVLIISLLFVGLFISLSMMDTHSYRHDIRTDYETAWDLAAQKAMAPR